MEKAFNWFIPTCSDGNQLDRRNMATKASGSSGTRSKVPTHFLHLLFNGRNGAMLPLLKWGTLALMVLVFGLIATVSNAEMKSQGAMQQQMMTPQSSSESSGMMGGQQGMTSGMTESGAGMEKSQGQGQMMGSGMMSGGMMSSGMMGGGMGRMMGSEMMGGHQAGGGMMGAGMHGMMGLNIMDAQSLKGMAAVLHKGSLADLKEELGLTAAQVEQLKGLMLDHKRDIIRNTAARKLAQLDLYELLDRKEVDLLKAQDIINKIANLSGELKFSGLEKMVKAKALLTDEQRNKLEALPGPKGKGMGRCGMMGDEKTGAHMGSMMGEQQTGGHMGGMMGGQQSGGQMGGMMSAGTTAQAAVTPGFTKSSEAAGVTITMNYLNPSQNIPKGELAFQVKLDTHSVDLDQFKLGQISFLQDEKGREYPAKGWQPSQGSGGHHVSGILTFSNLDSEGKEVVPADAAGIKVAVKGLAGVKERLFEWNVSSK